MLPPASNGGSAGFVQILVLVGLVTLSGIVTAVLATSTLGNKSAAALERLIRGDTIGRSALVQLTASLADPSNDLASRALSGSAQASVEIGGVSVALRIESQSGKIDVMRADPQLIDNYIARTGVEPAERRSVAQALAEARAKHDSAAALAAVTTALIGSLTFDQLAGDLTRFGLHEGVDPLLASPRVLAAIPDLGASQAAQIIASPQSASQLGITSRYFSSDNRHFEVIARIEWSKTEISTIRVPMELTASGRFVALSGPSWRAPA